LFGGELLFGLGVFHSGFVLFLWAVRCSGWFGGVRV
jgi:hypothetical protein